MDSKRASDLAWDGAEGALAIMLPYGLVGVCFQKAAEADGAQVPSPDMTPANWTWVLVVT